jgi:hypothetical protein
LRKVEHFPGVIEARAVANQDLNQAVAFETMRLVEYLAERRLTIYLKLLKPIMLLLVICLEISLEINCLL